MLILEVKIDDFSKKIRDIGIVSGRMCLKKYSGKV